MEPFNEIRRSRNQEFSFGHIILVLSTKHPVEDVKQSGGYASLGSGERFEVERLKWDCP